MRSRSCIAHLGRSRSQRGKGTSKHPLRCKWRWRPANSLSLGRLGSAGPARSTWMFRSTRSAPINTPLAMTSKARASSPCTARKSMHKSLPRQRRARARGAQAAAAPSEHSHRTKHRETQSGSNASTSLSEAARVCVFSCLIQQLHKLQKRRRACLRVGLAVVEPAADCLQKAGAWGRACGNLKRGRLRSKGGSSSDIASSSLSSSSSSSKQ